MDTQACLSFTVNTYFSYGNENHSKNVTIKYEKLKRVISSTYNDWEWDNQSTNSFDANAPDPSLYRIFLQRSASHIVECFIYPFDLAFRSGIETPYYIGMDSTFTLNGKKYNNVVKFNVDFDGIYEKGNVYIPSTTYYWAKDVGLIKKELRNFGYSWNLIDYKIIP